MKTQLSRREQAMPAPRLLINPDIHDFYQFTPDDIRLDNYQHLGKLSMEVAV
jgi:thymidylate synthase